MGKNLCWKSNCENFLKFITHPVDLLIQKHSTFITESFKKSRVSLLVHVQVLSKICNTFLFQIFDSLQKLHFFFLLFGNDVMMKNKCKFDMQQKIS